MLRLATKWFQPLTRQNGQHQPQPLSLFLFLHPPPPLTDYMHNMLNYELLMNNNCRSSRARLLIECEQIRLECRHYKFVCLYIVYTYIYAYIVYIFLYIDRPKHTPNAAHITNDWQCFFFATNYEELKNNLPKNSPIAAAVSAGVHEVGDGGGVAVGKQA